MSDQTYDIIICAKCGQKMRVPTTAKGRAFKCVRCENIIRYLSPDTESASARTEGTTIDTGVSIGGFKGTLEQWLVISGIVSQEDISEALEIREKQGGYLLNILHKRSKLPEEILFEVLARNLESPRIDLSRLFVDKEIVELIPKHLCEERFVFPIDRIGRNLTLAMACPIDKETIHLMEGVTGLKVKPILARITEIEETINRYHKIKSGDTHAVISPASTVSHSETKTIKTKPAPEEPHPVSLVQFPEETTERERKDVGPVIDNLEYLPMPTTAEIALSMVLEDNEINMEDLGSIFAEDPSLATALLRWANTSIVSEERKIGNIWMALALLGQKGVRVLLKHINDTQPIVSEYPVLPISGRSKLCAKLAEKFAQSSQKVNPSLAYTTALIHQIGANVLYIAGQDEYKRIMRDSFPEVRLKRETEYFTINHAVAASLLASRWNFPEIIVNALGYYLEPFKAPGKSKDLAHILFISSIAGLYGKDSVHEEAIREALKLREKSIQSLGLDFREVVKALG